MHGWMVVRRSALLALVLLVPFACDPDDSPTDPTDPPAETGEPVTLDLSADSLAFTALGDSARLTAVVRDPDGNEVADPAVTWASLDSNVAAVDTAGGVTAAAAGVTRIVASAGVAADTALVAVQQVMATFEVTPAADSLGEGDTLRIAVLVADSNGVAIEDPAIEWASEDEAVATVDDSGLVTAVREGEAVITARAGGLSRTATITVHGKIAFFSDRNGTVQIYVMNTDGSGITRITDQAQSLLFAWSPDGSRIAFVSFRNGNNEIYTVAADGSELTRITNNPSRDRQPVWSPDGTKIAFVRDSAGSGIGEIHVMAADGSGEAIAITKPEPGGFDGNPVWSPDGTRIAFMHGKDIYVKAADGGGQAVNITEGMEGDRLEPAWSPDGTRIAFVNRTVSSGVSDYEVYVIAADGSGEARNLTNHAVAADGNPVWSPDGSRIAFTSDRAGYFQIYVVDVESGDVLRLTHDLNVSDGAPSWSPDGDRLTFSRSLPDLTGDIYVINADGSGETRLTSHEALDTFSLWRPRP